jgi:hypothetical protein
MAANNDGHFSGTNLEAPMLYVRSMRPAFAGSGKVSYAGNRAFESLIAV